MSLNTTTGELMESVVHDDHLYGVPGCPMISKTMTISDLVFELINDSLNDVVSPWKSSIPKVYPDEVHFRLKLQQLSLQSFLNKETTDRFVFFEKIPKMSRIFRIKHSMSDIQKWFNSLFWSLK